MGARVAILASGAGTNLQALLRADLGPDVAIVAAGGDRPDARALRIAADAGVETAAFALGDYPDRGARDAAIGAWLERAGVDVVVLAGYMAILDGAFIDRFRDRILNVHPSLLPAFPGAGAIASALAHGVRTTGVTVHLVDDGVDTGPILLQEAIAIDPTVESVDQVHARLQPIEHRLLPEGVRLLAAGRVRRDATCPRRLAIDSEADATTDAGR